MLSCPGHAPLAQQTRIPTAQLTNELVSWLWERRDKYDPARGAFPTFATKRMWGRLVDLSRSAGTAKAKKFVSVAAPPDTQTVEKSKLSVTHQIDTGNTLAVLGAIARVVADKQLRGKVLYRPHLPHTRAQILACLVVGLDRKDSLRALVMRLRASASLRDAIGIKREGVPSHVAFHRAAHSRWATSKRIAFIHARAVALRAQVDEQ